MILLQIHVAPEGITGCAKADLCADATSTSHKPLMKRKCSRSRERVYHQGSGFGGSMRHLPIDKPKDFYRVFAPGVPNVRVMSEPLSEADARSRRREILMAYPAATVRIEKTDESERAK